MNTRLFVCVYGAITVTALGLMTGAGLLVAEQNSDDAKQESKDTSQAASDQFNARNTSGSAVQRELDALFGEQGKRAPAPSRNAASKMAPTTSKRAGRDSNHRHAGNRASDGPSKPASQGQVSKPTQAIKQFSGWLQERTVQLKKQPTKSASPAAADEREKQPQTMRNPLANLLPQKASRTAQKQEERKPHVQQQGTVKGAVPQPVSNPLANLLPSKSSTNEKQQTNRRVQQSGPTKDASARPAINPLANLFPKSADTAETRRAKPHVHQAGAESEGRPRSAVNPLSELFSNKPANTRSRTARPLPAAGQPGHPRRAANSFSEMFPNRPTPSPRRPPARAQVRPAAASHTPNLAAPKPPTNPLGDLGNLFPEMSEAKADRHARTNGTLELRPDTRQTRTPKTQPSQSHAPARQADQPQRQVALAGGETQSKPQTTPHRPTDTKPSTATAAVTQQESPKPKASPGGGSVLQQLEQLSARQNSSSPSNSSTSQAKPKTSADTHGIPALGNRPSSRVPTQNHQPKVAAQKSPTKADDAKPKFNLFSDSRKPDVAGKSEKTTPPSDRTPPRVAKSDGDHSRTANPKQPSSFLERVLPIENILPFGKQPATTSKSESTDQPRQRFGESRSRNDRQVTGQHLAQKSQPSQSESKATAVPGSKTSSKPKTGTNNPPENPLLNIPRLLPEFLQQPPWQVSGAKPTGKPSKAQQSDAQAQPTLAPPRTTNSMPTLQERIQSLVRPQPAIAARTAGNTMRPTPAHFEPVPDPISTPIAEPVAQPAAEPTRQPVSAKPQNNQLSDLGNLFPEMSEVEADQKPSNDGPYTGLKLADRMPASSSTAIAKPTSPSVQPSAGPTAANAEAAHSTSQTSPIKPSTRAKKAPETDASKTGRPESNETVPVAAARPPAISDKQDPPQKSESTEAERPNVSPVANRSEPAAKLPEIHSRDPQRQKEIRIAERVGLTGFKGFCPVVLREQRELSDSDLRFASTFEGEDYYFSSEEAKAKFDSDPAKYAPVAGGNDVVLLSNSGEAVEGKLDFAVWYQDRLYLFHSRDTLQQFVLEPSKHKPENDEPLAP